MFDISYSSACPIQLEVSNHACIESWYSSKLENDPKSFFSLSNAFFLIVIRLTLSQLEKVYVPVFTESVSLHFL